MSPKKLSLRRENTMLNFAKSKLRGKLQVAFSCNKWKTEANQTSNFGRTRTPWDPNEGRRAYLEPVEKVVTDFINRTQIKLTSANWDGSWTAHFAHSRFNQHFAAFKTFKTLSARARFNICLIYSGPDFPGRVFEPVPRLAPPLDLGSINH